MKKYIINMKHHISAHYAILMDYLFGYKNEHWAWYMGIVEKYLDEKL